MNPFDFVIVRPEWESLVRQVADQQNAKGLPRLEELSPRGRYSLKLHRKPEFIRYTLYYIPLKSNECIMIGQFSLKHEAVKEKSIKIPVGHPIHRSDGLTVIIQVDDRGLPYPSRPT